MRSLTASSGMVLLVSLLAFVDIADAFIEKDVSTRHLVQIATSTKSSISMATTTTMHDSTSDHTVQMHALFEKFFKPRSSMFQRYLQFQRQMATIRNDENSSPTKDLPTVSDRTVQMHALFQQLTTTPRSSAFQRYQQYQRQMVRTFFALQRLFPRRKHLVALAFAAAVWLRGPLLVLSDMDVAHAVTQPVEQISHRYQFKITSAKVTVNPHEAAPAMSTMQLARLQAMNKKVTAPVAVTTPVVETTDDVVVADPIVMPRTVDTTSTSSSKHNDLTVAGISTVLGAGLVVIPGTAILVARKRSIEHNNMDDVDDAPETAVVNGDSRQAREIEPFQEEMLDDLERLVGDMASEQAIDALVEEIDETSRDDDDDDSFTEAVMGETAGINTDDDEDHDISDQFQTIENLSPIDDDDDEDPTETKLTSVVNAVADDEQHSVLKAIAKEYDRTSIEKALERIKQELEIKQQARKDFAGTLSEAKSSALFSDSSDRFKILGERVRQLLAEIQTNGFEA